MAKALQRLLPEEVFLESGAPYSSFWMDFLWRLLYTSQSEFSSCVWQGIRVEAQLATALESALGPDFGPAKQQSFDPWVSCL
jgi:hypothetical protein